MAQKYRYARLIRLTLAVAFLLPVSCSQSRVSSDMKRSESPSAVAYSDHTAEVVATPIDFEPGTTHTTIDNAKQFAAQAHESWVELDIFSGRPNPVWALSESEVTSLGEILGSLKPAAMPGARFDGLGYRGFIVHLVAPQSLTPSTLYAYAGSIEIVTGADKIYYQDPQRQVELWLLDRAKPYISDELQNDLFDAIK
jgi:hypothetical protein